MILDPNAPPAGAPSPETETQAPAASPGAPAPERPRSPVPAFALPESALLAKKEKWQRKAREAERAAVLAELGIADLDAYKRQQAELAKQADAERARDAAADKGADPAAAQAQAQRDQEIEAMRTKLAEVEAERDKAKKQRDKARAKLTGASVELLAREAAGDHIDPVMYEDAREALRRHVAALPEAAKDAFTQDQARKFFADLAKKKPGFARRAGAPKLQPPPPAKKPLTTGPSPARAAPVPPKASPVTPTAGSGKTAAPGKPNSMSDAEVREVFKTKFGVDYRPPGKAAGYVPARPNGAPR